MPSAKHDQKVVFQVNERRGEARHRKKSPRKTIKNAINRSAQHLVPKYTFENFVIGASNQFAHAACMAVANQPGDNYNPLFIYGGVGLGKTHLVNAIGHQAAAQRAGLKVVYLSSESFMNELIAPLGATRWMSSKRNFGTSTS